MGANFYQYGSCRKAGEGIRTLDVQLGKPNRPLNSLSASFYSVNYNTFTAEVKYTHKQRNIPVFFERLSISAINVER
jgi:hypothetical protein